MTTTFLHTADWQIGKPFAGVEDSQKRALLQAARVQAIRRMGEEARARGAEFVVVAGDLFDSASATKATVSAACAAIGEMRVPVYVIPGNHDHGGAGSVWGQEFFDRERRELAPNLQVLLKPDPVELEKVVLFPCPLLRRHESNDLTAWLRGLDLAPYGEKVRVVLAHGSAQRFDGMADEEEGDSHAVNLIDLERLGAANFDYIALGDWHGAKKMGEKAWYSGTPELDRFVKGEDHRPGNVLMVTAERGAVPLVEVVGTGQVGWHDVEMRFSEDADLERLEAEVGEKLGNRVQQDLLRVRLEGQLGIEATGRLEQVLEKWRARVIRMKLVNQTTIQPTADELSALTQRAGDPLVARVAQRLMEKLAAGGDEGAVARTALRELHAACVKA